MKRAHLVLTRVADPVVNLGASIRIVVAVEVDQQREWRLSSLGQRVPCVPVDQQNRSGPNINGDCAERSIESDLVD
jgi:hypothetical protein